MNVKTDRFVPRTMLVNQETTAISVTVANNVKAVILNGVPLDADEARWTAAALVQAADYLDALEGKP